MFRVLIADDEPSVIQSLEKSIDWGGLGLELTACVSGSRGVLDIIEKQRIDIAILDIRMPGMSGLELCEILKEKQENIQLIIISGYAEFSYAERAIHYGVLGYCLKPLEYDKITKLLRKAVKNLKGKIQLGETDILEVLERGKIREAEQILESKRIHSNRCYVCVVIGEEIPAFGSEYLLPVSLGRGQFGYLSAEPVETAEIQSLFLTKGIWGIGWLSEPVSVQEIPGALEECLVKAFQFFVDPNCKPGEIVQEQKSVEVLGQIRQNMDKGRWEAVIEQLSEVDEKYYSCFTVRTASRLCNMIHSSCLFEGEETDYYIYNLKQLIVEYGTFSNMLGKLKAEISTMRMTGEREESYSNTTFMKLMVYIRENYRKDISLASASEAIHMNPNYISQLFKKEAGITFVHYVTQLRMEDAIYMLVNTDKPVVDIAMEIGINDYFYFMKLFKKYTGKTPSQYREENQ